MREILFRGKRIDNGEWFYGDLLQNIDVIKIREQEKEIKHIARSFVVVPETVGQYTGLIDKNGIKIFEGDILKGVSKWLSEPMNGFVAFKNGVFGFIWYRGKTEEFLSFSSVHEMNYEVIGNIHDNPELLRGEN